ncbi:MAG TPA: ferrous iron transport protein B [Tepidisphaeraceae bacterium]|nr:ferrous iron transport protein B [Tepidisphaeraceae bacterium]
MSSCCDTSAGTASASATLTVALAGNPNCGKTTIFNALTGLRQKVANYPGVTVEKKTGRCKLAGGAWIDVIDLPGTYSLISRSPDERVAMEVLRGLRPDTPAPGVVVVVVDASNLQRNLYLVSQMIELGRPLVVALNMMDVAERRGVRVSPAKLQKQLGVPVVPVVAHKRKGINELKAAIAGAKVAPLPDWPLPAAMKEELLVVGGGLAILDSGDRGDRVSGVGVRGSGQDKGPADAHGESSSPDTRNPTPETRSWICRGPDDARRLDRYQAIAERLLIGDHAADVVGFTQQQPVARLLDAALARLGQLGIDPMQADVEAHYKWIESVATGVTAGADEVPVALRLPGGSAAVPYEAKRLTLTDKVDSVLIHRVWGFAVFAAVMGLLFFTIFWLADPMMGAIEKGVTALGALASSRMADGPLKDLVTDGIFAGVGAVVVFIPQIALLFLFLAILEDSGYLARAAFLMDRALSKVGLHGKSFIPLLSSFACAIPGIMATRTIENRKDRLATIFVAPFMSCSARLPVYTLLIGAFFAGYGALAQAGIMLSLYGLGIVAAAATAWAFKRSMLKGPKAAFILEMPTYKVPQPTQVARVVIGSTWAFIAKAGTIIFVLSVVLWAAMYYGPRDVGRAFGGGEPRWQQLAASGAEENAVKAAQLDDSFAGRFGHAIEPVIRPLGYDWKMGVGLVGAFAAREVFVSTMGIVYSVGDDDENTAPLEESMKADHRPDGRPVWTPAVAASLLVWFVLAMQCMSTLAIVKRETGGWKWPVAMLLYMNALAYVAALVVYQVGSRWSASA